MMTNDLLKNPELQAFLKHAEKEMLPKMQNSDVSVTLYSGKVDIKLCLEVGAAILFNKPIIVGVYDDAAVPPSLAGIARAIVRCERDDPKQEKLQRAIEEVLAQIEGDKPVSN